MRAGTLLLQPQGKDNLQEGRGLAQGCSVPMEHTHILFLEYLDQIFTYLDEILTYLDELLTYLDQIL